MFPHNLRHLFATIFYRAYKDIARLADVLGHSSLETTRIYLKTAGAEHVRQLDRLNLTLKLVSILFCLNAKPPHLVCDKNNILSKKL